MDNWRPISMLSCLSKIFKRIMADRIRDFCEANNVIPNHQFGFQRGHSTSHPLAILQNKINDGLNTGCATTLVCLDVKAAFDSVWHDGLIYKLHSLKFPSYIIHIIHSFLKDRSFYVKFRSKLSNTKNIVAGVPQGSVLAPILFNIYCHDFPTSSDFLLLQFADDTAIATSQKNTHGLQNKINAHLIKIQDWYSKWKMLLNVSKSDVIHVLGMHRIISSHYRRSFRNMSISINNVPIQNKKVFTYLGVYFAENNRFNRHIDNVIDKTVKA